MPNPYRSSCAKQFPEQFPEQFRKQSLGAMALRSSRAIEAQRSIALRTV